MEQIHFVVLVLMVLLQGADGTKDVRHASAVQVCTTQEECDKIERDCTREGHDAVERSFRQHGREVAAFVCVKTNMSANN